jgi:hypothetical protein
MKVQWQVRGRGLVDEIGNILDRRDFKMSRAETEALKDFISIRVRKTLLRANGILSGVKLEHRFTPE